MMAMNAVPGTLFMMSFFLDDFISHSPFVYLFMCATYIMMLLVFCWCSVQIEETDEARKKFSNAKSISSAQFFGDQNKSGDIEAKASLQKFSVCNAALVETWQRPPLICIPTIVLIFSVMLVFSSSWGSFLFFSDLDKLSVYSCYLFQTFVVVQFWISLNQKPVSFAFLNLLIFIVLIQRQKALFYIVVCFIVLLL